MMNLPEVATLDLGSLGRFRILLQEPGYDLTEAWHSPGSTTPLHRHTRYSEHLLVLDGEIEGWIDDRHVRLVGGDAVTIPIGAVHTIRTGPNGSHSVVSSRPGRFAELMAGVVMTEDGTPDLEAFGTLAASFGDEILAPPGTLPSEA